MCLKETVRSLLAQFFQMEVEYNLVIRPRYKSGVYDIMMALDNIVTENMMHDMILSTEKCLHFVPNRLFAAPQLTSNVETHARDENITLFLKQASRSYSPLELVVPIQYEKDNWALVVILIDQSSKTANHYFYFPIRDDVDKSKIVVNIIRPLFQGFFQQQNIKPKYSSKAIVGPPPLLSTIKPLDSAGTALMVYTMIRILRTEGMAFQQVLSEDDFRLYAPVLPGKVMNPVDMKTVFDALHTKDLKIVLNGEVLNGIVNDEGTVDDKLAYILSDFNQYYSKLDINQRIRYFEALGFLLYRYGYEENVYGFDTELIQPTEDLTQKTDLLRLFKKLGVLYNEQAYHKQPRLLELMSGVQILSKHSYFPKTYVLHSERAEPLVLFMPDDQVYHENDQRQLSLLKLRENPRADFVALITNKEEYTALEESLHKRRPWCEKNEKPPRKKSGGGGKKKKTMKCLLCNNVLESKTEEEEDSGFSSYCGGGEMCLLVNMEKLAFVDNNTII